MEKIDNEIKVSFEPHNVLLKNKNDGAFEQNEYFDRPFTFEKFKFKNVLHRERNISKPAI